MGQPYVPHVIEHDTKDVIFFNLSGQRSSSPFSQYGSVPTAAERSGDLSGLTTQEGAPITIYDPKTKAPFPNNIIPAERIASQATALFHYIPEPTCQDSSRITSGLPPPNQHHPDRRALYSQLWQQFGRLTAWGVDPPIYGTGRPRHTPERESEFQLQSPGGR